jgi:hypothetical protein
VSNVSLETEISAGSVLYLDLLKRCLVNVIYRDPPVPMPPATGASFDLAKRVAGGDRPSQAHTMIGLNRLDNLQQLIGTVIRDRVPGDLIETGVARGGAAIFMRAVLKAYDVTDRRVFVADSFGSFPRSAESGITRRSYSSPVWRQMGEAYQREPAAFERMAGELRAGTSYDEVRDTFARYGMLDDQVCFLPGWFSETLRTAPIAALGLLRIDADLYDSTREALIRLYPKVSPGGYTVVDDYHTFAECREAVDEYLAGQQSIELRVVDEAVYWRKPAPRG